MKYLVTGEVTISCLLEIEADSEDEARTKAADAPMQQLCNHCATGGSGIVEHQRRNGRHADHQGGASVWAQARQAAPSMTSRCRHPQRYRLRTTSPDQIYCSKCERYLAAPRPGAGQPPVRGQAQRERLHLKLTEAELAEIQAAAGAEPLGPWIIEAALMRGREQEVRTRLLAGLCPPLGYAVQVLRNHSSNASSAEAREAHRALLALWELLAKP